MIRLLQLLIITFFAILVSTETEACGFRLSWDYVPMRENGGPMPASQIKQFEIRCVGLNVKNSFVKYAKPKTRAYSAYTSKPGRYSCIMRVHDTWGLVSKPSNVAEGECK